MPSLTHSIREHRSEGARKLTAAAGTSALRTRFRSCHRRSRLGTPLSLGTSLSPDAGTRQTRRRDTRPRTRGWRLPYSQCQHDRKKGGSKHVMLAVTTGKSGASQKTHRSQRILTFSKARNPPDERTREFRGSCRKIPIARQPFSAIATSHLALPSDPGVMQ